MPRIPMSRAGQMIAQRAPTPRVGSPATNASGLQDVARTLGGIGQDMAQRQAVADRVQEQAAQEAAAAKIKLERDQAAAEAKRALEQEQARAKLAVGNAVNSVDLQLQAYEADLLPQLRSGQITGDQYRKSLATYARKQIDQYGKDLPELGRQQYAEGVQTIERRVGAATIKTLAAHRDEQTLAEVERGAELLQRQAINDLPGALAQARGLYGADGPVAAILGPKKAAEAQQRFAEGAARAHFLQRISGAQGSGSQLSALRKEVAADKHLDPTQQAALLSSIDSRQQVLISRAEVATARRERDQERAFSALRDLDVRGLPVSAEFAAETLARLKGSPMESAAREILTGAAETAAFGAKPPAEQARIIEEQMREAVAKGVNPESSKQLDRLKRMHEAAAQEYASNPWQAAANRGQLDGVPPIDTTSAQGFVASVARRLEQADTIDHLAGRVVSPLQPQEVTGLAQMLGALAAPERAEMLGELQTMIGSPRLKALSAQLAKDDPTLALVASAEANQLRLPDGQSIGGLIMAGEEAIKSKVIKREPMIEQQQREAMHELLGDAIQSPAARQAAMDAAMKLMAGKAAAGDSLDPEDALQAVTGRVVEHAGAKTLAPIGWTESEFRAAVSAITPLRITEAAGGGALRAGSVALTPERLAEQMAEIGLQAASGGRYALRLGNQLVTTERGDRRVPVYITLDKPAGAEPGFFGRVFGGDRPASMQGPRE